MHTRFFFGWLTVAALSMACSEAKDDDEDGEGGADTTGSSSSASGSNSASASVTGAGGGGTSDIVVNEISGSDDWIELYNRGSSPVDLGGLTLADQDTPGVPKPDEAIIFPAGTTIAPGGYLFILAKQDTAPAGEVQPQTMCTPGPSPCFYAPFGISATDGDAIFVLDGMTLLASADFPAAAVPDTQSYCRLPDGGALAACTPTPGATNAAP